jgi:chemotaxis response regulator CheB
VPGGPIVVLLVDDQAFIAAAIRQLIASEPDIEPPGKLFAF